MPTLQEILAAKKAAAALPPTPAEAPVPPKEISPIAALETKTLPEPVKEGTAIAAPKALSFQEKMALKRAEEAAKKEAETKASTLPAQPVPSSEEKPVPIPASDATQILPAESIAAVKTAIIDSSSPEVKAAYADIKIKIDNLNAMSDTDLKTAMSDLKKSLMANPAAVSLMEDSDIGQMVIALRKLTGEAIIEAQAEKKAGRKPKVNVDLNDPDAVAKVFDEL